ncbi:MAG: 1-deoxy-D-xylulose-5-phosphate synthase [Ruminococcaceae bacterium]|nr:1-deoxy-D-xylulose-5-phosphate synthase [Oscillospiraceae bacterium]
MSQEILSTIKSPKDLKTLSNSQLKKLCKEIREQIIDTVSCNGGHLSPNLGVVELTVMLHYVFDCPDDSIVWDVGHQCYTHKMLTGRFDSINTIRTQGGLSGFPKRSESEYDAFNAGHSSTSISAAFGIAKAKQLLGEDSHTIAVIGDGSLTGGLAYEGLNNAGRFKKNFIVILNDNKMSISQNVGAMAKYLTSIRVKPGYLRAKNRMDNFLERIPLGDHIRNSLKRSKKRVKRIVYKDTLFDQLGYRYYGPVDGHDIDSLRNALQAAKTTKGPVLVHVQTKKGKGYQYAESDSASFHGIGQFDIDTGEPISSKTDFSTVFGEGLCKIAQEDERICAVTAAMRTGTGLYDFSRRFKDRFFDVGIAEEHAVTFSCGMATKGMIPVFAVYSTFLQRGYDQLLHDAAMQKLHMVVAVDRAGIVGEDGETHQGVFDVSMLNSIPNTTIFSPCYFDEMKQSLNTAIYGCDSLVAIRYPRGAETTRPADLEQSSMNYDIYGDRNAKKLLITYGRLFSNAVKAYEMLKKDGESICVLKLCKIKPIDKKAIEFAKGFEKIHFFEEGILAGGIGETFDYELTKIGYTGLYKVTAIEDRFIPHSKVADAIRNNHLDSQSMYDIMKND